MFYGKFLEHCNTIHKSPSAVVMEIGLNKSVVTSWKKGSTPTDATAKKIADYFGISTSDLLGETKDSPTTVTDDEAALNEELISRLCQLTEKELEKVDAFVQGLLSAR